MTNIRHAVVGFFASLALVGSAHAVPMAEFIDVGVPTDGTTRMDGFRGFILRITSPDDPITTVEFEDQGIFPGQTRIFGDIHQRWTDPTASGNYTQPSPGPLAADNLTLTDLNFDSHFLPLPPEADVQLLLETFSEQFGGFQSRVPFSPVASTPSVGYADPVDTFVPIEFDVAHSMQVVLHLPASANITQIDLAYIVTNSVVLASGGVETASREGVLVGVDAAAIVPEPSTAGFVATASALLACRRRRKIGSSTHIERLEGRRLLSGGDVVSTNAAIRLDISLDATSAFLD
jgi:hypothetical protein